MMEYARYMDESYRLARTAGRLSLIGTVLLLLALGMMITSEGAGLGFLVIGFFVAVASSVTKRRAKRSRAAALQAFQAGR